MDKIKFAVEKVEIVDEKNDSQFATIAIDAFASGDNRHNLIVSEETLRKTAYSIYNKPLVWIYDSMFDDIGTHDPLEVPCGFVPHDQEIKFTKLADGRTMMSVIGKIWKRYSGELLSIFKRDDGRKPVSVEMEVFDLVENQTGSELLDFCFSAITILGSLITPAIPGAKGTILSFSERIKEEYDIAYNSEFSLKYDDIDLSIPESVRQNALLGLELNKQFGRGGTPTTVSMGRHLLKNKTTHVNIKKMAKYFNRHKGDNLQKDPPSDEYIGWNLFGGSSGWRWSQDIVERMQAIDEQQLSFFGDTIGFPYKNLKDLNPALKGVDPPLTLGQANEIAKQADAIGSDQDKNGWAIAIGNFKKTHTVKDGRWIKKEEMSMTQKSQKDLDQELFEDPNKKDLEPEDKNFEKDSENTEDVKEEGAFEADPKDEDSKDEDPKDEDPKDEDSKDEDSKDEDSKDEGGDAQNMSLNSNLDVSAMLAMLEEETECYQDLVAECEKPAGEMDMGKFAKALFEKLEDVTEQMNEAKKQVDTFAIEVEELKKFKEDVQTSKFEFEVDATIESVSEFVPKAILNQLRENAKEFSLDNLDGWKNIVQAKAFSYVSGKEDKTTELRFDLPFNKEGNNLVSMWK